MELRSLDLHEPELEEARAFGAVAKDLLLVGGGTPLNVQLRVADDETLFVVAMGQI